MCVTGENLLLCYDLIGNAPVAPHLATPHLRSVTGCGCAQSSACASPPLEGLSMPVAAAAALHCIHVDSAKAFTGAARPQPTWGHLLSVYGPAAAPRSSALVPALARWARLTRLRWRRVLAGRQAHHVCVRLLVIVFSVGILSCIGPAECHKTQSK